MADTVQFTRDQSDIAVIDLIAKRAAAMDKKHNGRDAGNIQHHRMNISACHASGNPLRLAELLKADDFNFAHDIFGIDAHISHDTGAMQNWFSPRYSDRT